MAMSLLCPRTSASQLLASEGKESTNVTSVAPSPDDVEFALVTLICVSLT
jgi:hypothetical protein